MMFMSCFYRVHRRSLEEMVLVEGRFRWNRLDNLLREGAKSSELTTEQLWLLADFVVRIPPALLPNPAHSFLVAICGWAPRAVNSCLSRCGLSPMLLLCMSCALCVQLPSLPHPLRKPLPGAVCRPSFVPHLVWGKRLQAPSPAHEAHCAAVPGARATKHGSRFYED